MHRLPVATQEEPGLWGACFPKRVWVEQKTSVSLRRQPPCFRLGLGSRGACPSQTVRGQQGEKKQVLQTGAVAQWAEHPPGMQKTQGSTPPSFRKPGTGTLGRWRQGDQGIRVILSYIMGSRPVWATQDNVSKNREFSALSLSPRHDAPLGEVASLASRVCSQLFLPPLREQTSSQRPCPGH